MSTKRTILSPFTKEYRVHAAFTGIRLFLEEFLFVEKFQQSIARFFPLLIFFNNFICLLGGYIFNYLFYHFVTLYYRPL